MHKPIPVAIALLIAGKALSQPTIPASIDNGQNIEQRSENIARDPSLVDARELDIAREVPAISVYPSALGRGGGYNGEPTPAGRGGGYQVVYKAGQQRWVVCSNKYL